MTTIVLNTRNSAVTEYDWAFQSITPAHAGDASGLFVLGGDDDAGKSIAVRVTTGRLLWGTTLKKAMSIAFFSIIGAGRGEFEVHGTKDSWRYEFLLRDGNVSRCPVGRGIRENYLAFTFTKPDGNFFILDQLEVLDTASASRRS